MRQCAQVLVGVLLVCLSSLFVSCSADDNNNNFLNQSSMAVSSINIEKKWIVAHYDFMTSIDRGHKEAYQKSVVEIEIMKDGVYKSIDKYSLKESKGQWELNGDVISLSNNATGEVLRYRIEELNRADAIVCPINCKEISKIELVSFSK